MAAEWTYLLLRASLLLSLSSLAVLLLTRWQPVYSPRWHRAAWALVLLQGVLLFPGFWRVPLPAWARNLLLLTPTTYAPELHELAHRPLTVLQAGGKTAQAETRGRAHDLGSKESARSSAGTSPGSHAVAAAGRSEDVPPVTAAHAPLPLQPVHRPRASWGAGLTTDAALATGTHATGADTRGAIAGNRSARKGHGAQSESVFSAPSQGPAAGRQNSSEDVGAAAGGAQDGPIGARLAGLPLKSVLVVWLLGAAALTALLAANYVLLLCALRRCRPAAVAWTGELHRLCLELGIDGRVRLEVHACLGPFLCWAPGGTRVVVPARLWSRLSEAERTAVLHHELCHLRRGDLWKALLARLVVGLHWFNPLAWLAVRRFDESAEWACDALMANEAPRRITPLANALLAAARGAEVAACGALAASGGPVFRRIRRLLAGKTEGDRPMSKIHWFMVLAAVALLAAVRPQLATLGEPPAAETPSTVEREEADELETSEAEAPSNLQPEAPVDDTGTEAATASGDARLDEFASRIVIGEDENLQRFVHLLRTEAGRVVMADRAALAAQDAAPQEDGPGLWEAFVASRFEEREGSLAVRDEHAEALATFADKVERGAAAIREMEGVFREAAGALEITSDAAAMLKRFLLHEGSCASVYYYELRSSLHPDVQDVVGQLEDMLVRTGGGRYVVRPARRAAVAQQLAQAEALSEVLDRLHQELRAWADELVDDDALHAQLKKALRSRSFAEYLALREVEDRSRIRDEDLEGIFWRLEEATDDVAAGLKLNQDSEACRALAGELERFSAIWEQRDVLREPVGRLVELIEEKDELHHRLRQYLRTDTALIALAVEMDYLPRPAAVAAQEWLAYRAVKNDAGRLELSVESPEQLAEELSNYFAEFRELRRRGRSIDAFAARLADSRLKQVMQSYLGKLMLRELVQQSAVSEDADGLQIWFDQHFEETPEGLVLREGAGEALAELLEQAAEIEAQLQEADF